MIGVLSRADEAEVIAEFFQLFKTPWEPFQAGRSYDVVFSTGDDILQVKARLLILFGSQSKRDDSRRMIAARPVSGEVLVRHGENEVPIYTGALVFDGSTTWKPCLESSNGTVGVKAESGDGVILRVGYDLFREVKWLLSSGQPVEHAHLPTLELHIMMLRDWMIEVGISFLEIPPVPDGKRFVVCLTHDIDFIGIRDHKFDHTMWGFLHRSTLGALRGFVRRRISLGRLLQIWRAAASLPLVWLGWVKDFWLPFDWYLRVEHDLPATYFLIPFKGRTGDKVTGRHANRRATKYDVTGLSAWTSRLLGQGCEMGVHGIDAWHSAALGRAERERIAAVTGRDEIGTRSHWLLRDENSARVLEEAGYAYDSTEGYNETIGYRSGTTQVFRPLGARRLLELPMHIQDGALFYSHRLDLSEDEAWARCGQLIENAGKFGGVLTCLWHDRSHGPERFWGDFYIRLVGKLRTLDVWFATAGQVVAWFRSRREVVFARVKSNDEQDQVSIRSAANSISPPLTLRIHCPANMGADGFNHHRGSHDVVWNGSVAVTVEELIQAAAVSTHTTTHLK